MESLNDIGVDENGRAQHPKSDEVICIAATMDAIVIATIAPKTLPKTTFMTPWILLLELQPLILQYKIFIPSFFNSHNNHNKNNNHI